MNENKRTTNISAIQTIENIEKDYWGDKPDYDSHLVTAIYKLRKKDLVDFSVEDLRIIIGQNLSLPILIPKALDVLERNILAEGDFYPGDLLQNVLTISPKFWATNPELKDKFKKIFIKNTNRIKGSSLSEKNKEKLFVVYEQFLDGTIEDRNVFNNYANRNLNA